MNTSHSSLRVAFSLVELLAVISIIAVLLSMLMPAITMMRDVARGATCMSNLRQVSLAYLTYVNDNDNILPNKHAGANANHFDPTLFDQYLPSTDKVWSCTAPKLRSTTFVSNWWMNTTPYGNSPAGQLYGQALTIGIPMAKVVRPSQAWLAADLDGNNIGDYHRGYANMCFVDGHTMRRVDRTRSMNVVAWVNLDPSDSLKAEYIYSKTPVGMPGISALVKGFNYLSPY